ncbi:Sterile alpha motif domain [Dillenia turbinata]|uniref:Sterile alpha motif domain n=1 Tax=Dillenia turbinata TaxID=194707 RepID=A0AAN8V2Z4_9MAGN
MAAEIQQPPENLVNGGAGGVGGAVAPLSETVVGSKRQRRPSVRLGDIGGQPATLSYDSHLRRAKQWDSKFHRQKEVSTSNKASKTRNLMNLAGSSGVDYETLHGGEDKSMEGNLDSVAIGSWKVRDSKSKRGGTKRIRSAWASKVDGDEKLSGGEDVDEGLRDFDPEGSQSPLKEHDSPIHSLENLGVDPSGNDREVHFHGQRRGIRVHDGGELDGPQSDTEARNWKDRNGNGGLRERCRSPEDGVRIWLNGLGLGRYAPVFEIHEVDDEVLPMLTLEDLKDMGINAVGSRRKMYCAIQKLGKGFS